MHNKTADRLHGQRLMGKALVAGDAFAFGKNALATAPGDRRRLQREEKRQGCESRARSAGR
jgi:hypothetical protein